MSSFQENHFRNSDGLNLFYRWYDAGRQAKTLVMLHGQGEHGGRYEKFLEPLKDLGISLAVLDFRGNGRSEGIDCYVDSFENHLEDVTQFAAHLKATHGIPEQFMLYGNSMGGLVAVHWALRHGRHLKALILSSPCLGLNLHGWIVNFNGLLNMWIPKYHYKNPIYPPYLTHDPDERKKYEADPLIRRKISVRLLHEMLVYGNKLKHLKHVELPCPLFILMAGIERVVDARQTERFFEKVKAPRKELAVFDNFYHEIFNELGQQEAFNTLKTYLSSIS